MLVPATRRRAEGQRANVSCIVPRPFANTLVTGVIAAAVLGRVSIGQVLKTIWPFYLAVLVVLPIVGFVPELSLWLPAALK